VGSEGRIDASLEVQLAGYLAEETLAHAEGSYLEVWTRSPVDLIPRTTDVDTITIMVTTT